MKDLNEKLEDLLTELDPPYESKEELRIGRMLDRYGIPFFYRQPAIIYHEGKNETRKPSFTLFSYGGAVIDYVAGTGEQVAQRQQLYRYNQIPAVVLGPRDLDRPDWDKRVYAKLEQIGRRAFDPMRYATAPVEK